MYDQVTNREGDKTRYPIRKDRRTEEDILCTAYVCSLGELYCSVDRSLLYTLWVLGRLEMCCVHTKVRNRL